MPAGRDPLRIGLADDGALFREGLARLLAEIGFQVAFQAATVEDLMAAVQVPPVPDVVITDVRMPPTFTNEGIVGARTLRADHPGIGVLVLSQYVESSEAARLIADDGRGIGYLLKDRVSNVTAIADAIRRVADGGTVIDPEVISRLMARGRERSPLAELSGREREVLGLMAEGHSNRAIGELLFIGQKTVETHIGTIFSKLELFPDSEVDRRVAAVLTYLRS